MFLIFPEILGDKPKHSKDMNFIVIALKRTLDEFYEKLVLFSEIDPLNRYFMVSSYSFLGLLLVCYVFDF